MYKYKILAYKLLNEFEFINNYMGGFFLDTRISEITNILPQHILSEFIQNSITFEDLREIRIRIGQPVIIRLKFKEILLKKCIVTKEDMNEFLEMVTNHSIYAYEEDITNGFITVFGGHRIGLAGKVIYEDNNIKNVKYISFANIRISHQIRGCANNVFSFIHSNENIDNTLIISSPGIGKTTLLRDLIRLISNGNEYYSGKTVGVVDERSELGACFLGRPQNDLGIRTDVLDCCHKSEGMIMLLRSMTPEVIAVDEIATKEDIISLTSVINCGLSVVATAHAKDFNDLKEKILFKELIQEKIFKKVIILRKNEVGNIVNEMVVNE